MKRMMRRLSSFFVMLAVAVSMALPASAANPSVTFEGILDKFQFHAADGFTSTDLFENFKDVMPGDVLTQEIEVSNNTHDSDMIDLYLRMEPHSDGKNPLSPEVAAKETAEEMNEFLSKLRIKIWNGTELLYAGAPNDPEGLKEYVSLGTLEHGESVTLKVELTVPLDLDNKYAGRIGEVDWIFLAEAITLPPVPEHVTIRKLWVDDGQNRPESVEVELLENGEVSKTITLSEENQWTYVWEGYRRHTRKDVREVNVPAGYTASYEKEPFRFTITNTASSAPQKTGTLTVEKVWADLADHPDSIAADLLKDGEVFDSTVLNAENNWTHTWSGLDEEAAWSVKEANVPEGYTASYTREGSKVTITNALKSSVPAAPADLTVRKVWSDKDDSKRPQTVTMQLCKDDTVVETVKLSASNNWEYTWKDLDGSAEWKVLETNIPNGYTPSYHVENGVVTVTNTATLIQTGQLSWLVPVLGGLGAVLLIAGCVLMLRRRKQNHA